MASIKLHDIPLGTFLKYFSSDDYSKDYSDAYYDNNCRFYYKKETVGSASYCRYTPFYSVYKYDQGDGTDESKWFYCAYSALYSSPISSKTDHFDDTVISEDTYESGYEIGSSSVGAIGSTSSNSSESGSSISAIKNIINQQYAVISACAASPEDKSRYTPFKYEYEDISSGHIYSQVHYDGASIKIYDVSGYSGYLASKSPASGSSPLASATSVVEITSRSQSAYYSKKPSAGKAYEVRSGSSVIGILYENTEVLIAKRNQTTDRLFSDEYNSDEASKIERFGNYMRGYSGVVSYEDLIASSQIADGSICLVYDESGSFAIGFPESASRSTVYSRMAFDSAASKKAIMGYIPESVVSSSDASASKAYSTSVRKGIAPIISDYDFRDLEGCTSATVRSDSISAVFPESTYSFVGEKIRIKIINSDKSYRSYYGKVSSISAGSGHTSVFSISKITVGPYGSGADFEFSNLPASAILGCPDGMLTSSAIVMWPYNTSVIASVSDSYSVSGLSGSAAESIPFKFEDIVSHFGPSRSIFIAESGSRGKLVSEYDAIQKEKDILSEAISEKLVPDSMGSYVGSIGFGESDSISKMHISCKGLLDWLEYDRIPSVSGYPSSFKAASKSSPRITLTEKEASSESGETVMTAADYEYGLTASERSSAEYDALRRNRFQKLFGYGEYQTEDMFLSGAIRRLAAEKQASDYDSVSSEYHHMLTEYSKDYSDHSKDVKDLIPVISSMLASGYSETEGDASTYGSSSDISIKGSYVRFVMPKVVEAMGYNDSAKASEFGNSVPYAESYEIDPDSFESIEKKILSGKYNASVKGR